MILMFLNINPDGSSEIVTETVAGPLKEAFNEYTFNKRLMSHNLHI